MISGRDILMQNLDSLMVTTVVKVDCTVVGSVVSR